MTLEEFETYKSLSAKFGEACRKYIESKQTFDRPDYSIETDDNDWNFVEEYDHCGDAVYFVVDTSGYKYEGERYIKKVSINEVLNIS